MRTLSTGLILVALTPGWIPAATLEVAVAAQRSPSALADLELPDGTEALALDADGATLAYAVFLGGPKDQSEIVLRGGASATVNLRGHVRDLLFLDDGRLLGLMFRPAKKWEGDTYLFAWTPGDKKVERLMRVPPSASDLDRWDGGNGLVLATRNEIRTFVLPDLRSGPVFMFPGDNRAITTLGASSYLWIGQDQGLFLIDLSAPSGREAMAVVARQDVPSPVAALAAYADGATALVRLDDGSLYRATLDPPGFEPAGSAAHLAGLRKGSSGPDLPRPAEPAETVAAAPAEEPPAQRPAAAAPEPPASPPAVVKTEPATPPAAEPPTPAAVEQTAPPVAEPATPPAVEQTEPPTPAAEPSPPPAPATGESHQLSGTLAGEIDLVVAVVLMGPNNIVHEAARVKPAADGGWNVDGLEPGRYRVQLDGGGDRVLLSDPRLVLVEIGDAPVVAPEIRVLRAF